MNKEKELPEGWKYKDFDEVLDIQGGSQPPKSKFIYEPQKNYVQLLQIRDFGKKPVPTYVPKELVTKFCTKEDVLVARYGASLGRIVTGLEGAYNVALAKIINQKGTFITRYLFYLLQTPIFQTPLKLLSRSAQNGFAKHEIAHIKLPVPSIPQQQKTVDKIEELFSELDKGIENLKIAQQQLKVYRQAVLKGAFEGKLTNENVQDGKLPEGWEWKILKGITKEISDGDHQPPPKTDIGIPFITISNVDKNGNKIDFSDTFTVSEEYYLKLKDNRKPFKGDVLYTVTGSFGIPILIDFEKEFCFQRHIGLIRPSEMTNQKWLYYLLQSPQVFNQAKQTATGTAQKTVALSSLRSFEVPYVEISEQEKIVQEIESRLSVCDKMEETITTSLQQADALRQSILKRAFEGKLVKKEASAVKLDVLITTEYEKEWQRKVLAGKIIEICYDDKNFGHTKFQKTLHLCEYHAQLEFNSRYIKDVAGPFDKDFFFPFLEEGRINNWFSEKPKQVATFFKPKNNLNNLVRDYDKYFISCSDKIQFTINLLKDKTTFESELISTIYAIWNNYLINGCDIHHDQLISETYEWSDSKVKFSEPDIVGMWQWMKDVKLVPVGYGLVI